MKNLGDLGDLIFFLSQNRIQGRVGNSSTLTSWISVDCDRLNKVSKASGYHKEAVRNQLR